MYDEYVAEKNAWLFVATLPTLCFMAIGLFLPPDGLEIFPLLEDAYQFARDRVPALAGYVQLSAHPQVTAATLSVGWILLPFQFVLWVFVLLRYGNYGASSSPQAGGALKATLNAALVSGVVFAGLFWVPEEWSFAQSWGMNSNRIGLAVLGGGGFFIISAMPAFVMTNIIRLVRGF